MKDYAMVLSRLEELGVYPRYFEKYSEPGYHLESGHQGILLGDWNKCPNGLQHALEEHFDLEWEDEWVYCEECGGIFRIQPDSYEWQKYGFMGDDICLCGDCVKEDPTEYEEYLCNNPRAVDTIGIDWTLRGWQKENLESYETGFFPGQSDDPHEILKKMQQAHPEKDFIFADLAASQFYITYSIFSRDKEQSE